MTHRGNVVAGREYTPPTNRIEAFSDGVFAIIVTLRVPALYFLPGKILQTKS